MRRFLLFIALFGLISFGTPAWANSSLWVVSGEAEAQITTGLNTVTITLTDLYVDPSSVSDNLSAFKFTLSNAPASTSITSSSGDKVTVSGPGDTVGSATATGWTLSLFSATTTLDDLSGAGHAGPANTIIGAPGSEGYGNANGSLTNGSHNPFLYETATFTLDEAGVTANTTVTARPFNSEPPMARIRLLV